MTQLFGDIRALLHETTDARSWELLCEKLDGVGLDELESIYLPYMMAHLDRWSDVRRLAPWRWIEGALRREAESVAKLRIVRAVDLSWRRLRHDQLDRLLSHAPLSGITHLYLDSCRLSPAALGKIVHHEAFESLKVLSLARNPLSRDGVAVLSSASALRDVVALDLEGCFLDDASVAGVLDATCFQRLESLDLSGNVLGVEAMEALAGSAQRETLRALNLTGCVARQGARIARGGPLLDVLATGGAWTQLEQLELAQWGLDVASVGGLDSALCTRLLVLDLNGSALLERGASRLAACEALGHVEVLDVGRNRIGDEGAQALVAPGSRLRALKQVNLAWNGVTAAMVRRLQEAGCEVISS